jgi:hypothetical protein
MLDIFVFWVKFGAKKELRDKQTKSFLSRKQLKLHKSAALLHLQA